jgi:hypothetical protein
MWGDLEDLSTKDAESSEVARFIPGSTPACHPGLRPGVSNATQAKAEPPQTQTDTTHPNTYYRNIPGCFIAGTVYDPEQQEVIIGARVRATNGGKTKEVLTDDFGDFWFEDLQRGYYEIVIEAEGYEYKTIKMVETKGGTNIGDIPLK